jgi:tetratricopeptide (TPR) repeat protein
VLNNCSWAFWNIGEHARALELAQQSYNLADTFLIKMNLAWVMTKNGLAEESLKLALKMDESTPPGYGRPHAILRDCYCLQENWDKALEHAILATDWGPEFYNRLIHAMILAELDRMEEAKAQVDVARHTLPRLKLAKSIAGQKLSFNNQPQFYRGLEKLLAAETD